MEIEDDIKQQIERVGCLQEQAARLPGNSGYVKSCEMKAVVHDAARVLVKGDIFDKAEILDRLAAFQ